MTRAKAVLTRAAVVAVAVAAAIVPLQARFASVTHDDWARTLVDVLDLRGGVSERPTPAAAFSVLSWRQSLAYPADSYLRADGVAIRQTAGRKSLVAAAPSGEVVYGLRIARGGDYRVRALVGGRPEAPVGLEIRPLAGGAPKANMTLVPRPVAGWVDGETTHLDPGAYAAALTLPPGTALDQVEVAPPCLEPIEPRGGWKAGADLTSGDLAVTTLQALDLESELAPAAAAIDVPASAFRPVDGGPVLMMAAGGLEASMLRAAPQGTRAVVFVHLPEAGLYTVSAFGIDDGPQSWLADSCHKAVLCPRTRPDGQPRWRQVMTARFTAGSHSLAVSLGSGAAVARVRFERKKDDPLDYVAALSRLGLDIGPAGPVSPARAEEAERFIREKRPLLPATGCGDVRAGAVTALAEPPAPPAVPGAPGFAGTGRPPLSAPEVPLAGAGPAPVPEPPVLPPGDKPAVQPTPAPPPPGPPPPLPPGPPPTVPPQPPGSPTTIASPAPGA